MKRKTTDEERILFKTHIDEARPFKAATPKPKKLGRALPPPRAHSALAGEMAAAAPALRRPEGNYCAAVAGLSWTTVADATVIFPCNRSSA